MDTEYIDQIRQECADYWGFHPAELDGENVLATVRDAERSGVTVYWGCVQSSISPTDTFPPSPEES